MQPRLSYQKAAPDVLQSMLALSAASKKSGLPPELIDLIDYRVSQINGCAFCLDMHSKDFRAHGGTEQRRPILRVPLVVHLPGQVTGNAQEMLR